jgi:hypothetical protein
MGLVNSRGSPRFLPPGPIRHFFTAATAAARANGPHMRNLAKQLIYMIEVFDADRR